MTNNFLNIFYISAILISALIFIRYITKDAKKFTGSEKSLSKIDNSIVNMLIYINANMPENGSFVPERNLKNSYKINPSKIYDTTLHAQTLYTLQLCNQKYDIPEFIKKINNSTTYLINNLTQQTSKINLSAIAMSLVALSNVTNKKLFSDEILDNLGQILLSMQTESGQFYNCYDFKTQKPDTSKLNFTGDAPLGLLFLYEYNPKEQWLTSAKKGLLFLAEKNKPDFNCNTISVIEKLFNLKNNTLTNDEKILLTNYIIRMVQPVLKIKFATSPDTAITIDGLISAYNCIDDENLKSQILRTIDNGIKFLRSIQVAKGPLKGGFPNSADWREKGVPKTASQVKMDTVQHALKACIKFQNMFTD